MLHTDGAPFMIIGVPKEIQTDEKLMQEKAILDFLDYYLDLMPTEVAK